MVACNVDLKGRHINRQIGYVFYFAHKYSKIMKIMQNLMIEMLENKQDQVIFMLREMKLLQ